MELTKSVLDCISTSTSGLIRINPQFPKEDVKKYSGSTHRFRHLHILLSQPADLQRLRPDQSCCQSPPYYTPSCQTCLAVS